MGRSSFDVNSRNTLIGVDSGFFTTPTEVAVNSATHAMLVEASVTLSGTSDVNLSEVGGSSFSLGQQLAAASLPVVLTAAQITTLTPPDINGTTATGTTSLANDTVSVSTVKANIVGFQITGGGTYTHAFQATIDGTNWFTIYGYYLSGGIPVFVSSQSADMVGYIQVAGYKTVRIRCTSHTSGTATITLFATTGDTNVFQKTIVYGSVGSRIVDPNEIDMAINNGSDIYALPVGSETEHDAVDPSSIGPIKIGGRASAAAPTSVSGDGDRVNAWFLRNGAQANVITAAGALIGGDAANGLDVDITRQNHGKTILSAGGSASSNGNNTLVAAGTNRLKVKAFSLTTTSTTAMTCIFQSGAGGTELWRVIIQAPTSVSAGANLSVPAPDWLFATASATLLNLNLSSANAVHWSVSYFDEA